MRRAATRAVATALAGAALGTLPPTRANDWPMLGGRPDRNQVAAESGLPVEWREGGPKDGRNLRWVAPLGRVTYGSPVIAGGRVFIGTDRSADEGGENHGVLRCFSERNGRLLWKVEHAKLTDPARDEDSLGICSTPCVDGDRVFYVSNRGELVCRQVEDGGLVWMLDMIASLGVSPNQASASSPLVVGDRVFVVTGQGADYRTGKVTVPGAPSFLALNRQTGAVLWRDSSPGGNVLTGQWGSPGYGVADGHPQVVFPGGDGWLYSFEPAMGRLLWKFNGKAHEEPGADGRPATMFNFVAAPVFLGEQVFVAIGEPEASSGPGALRCLDARQRGDVTGRAEVWRFGGTNFNDSISTVAVHEGLLYAADTPGFLNCIEVATGRRVWFHDLLATVWGSPLVADGKVYLQVGDGTVWIFLAGRKKQIVAQINALSDLAHGTPVAANGVLYLAGQSRLYAIATE